LLLRSQATHGVVGLGAPEEPFPVNILPTRRNTEASQKTGQTLGRGMDFALVVLVFLGIGYAIDRWLDTKPVFMIALVLFSVAGQFVKMYYDYSATMNQLEAQRAEQRQAQRV
jgi:F0F1-type ATP synthase assembly protein I